MTGERLEAFGEVLASVCADFDSELIDMDGEDDTSIRQQRTPGPAEPTPP